MYHGHRETEIVGMIESNFEKWTLLYKDYKNMSEYSPRFMSG